MHTPDRNFEDSDNELACAQLERNPTAAVCMGTALWHNSALCFPHLLGELLKQAQGVRDLHDRNLKTKKISFISVSEAALTFGDPDSRAFAALLVQLKH